jgi:lipopolysaccharide export LptBFGC system permease protein LptF
MAADSDKPSLTERFTRAVIKADTGPKPETESPQTVEELEEEVAHADDTERLIGLAAAPLAGLVAILVVSSLGVKSGRHTSSVDSTLTLVLFGLAFVMLASAWFRKRLFLGVACALYGLSIFNLHYWGFGVPFLLIGSWYLVRAYRLGQKLKRANEDDSPTGSTGPARRVAPNKRYTPPAAPPVKPPKPPKTDT